MFKRPKSRNAYRRSRPRCLPKWVTIALWASPIAIILVLILRVNVALLSTYADRIDWSKDSFWVEAYYSIGSIYDAAIISVNTFRSMTERHDIPVKSPLPTVRLNIELSSLEKMIAAPNHLKKSTYYSAQLMYPDGTWHPVKYRLRGRNVWHWRPEKPSLRIKLKKSLPIQKQRHINLINPEDRPMIANLYGEALAKNMGVLTHTTKFVRVFINEEYKGVYHWSTREDESLLIHKRRVPGPLFIGDTLGIPWDANQFEAAGKKDVLKHINPMKKLVAAMQAPLSPDRYQKLWNILSKEKYASWIALNNLVSSIHSDKHHNINFYFDPSTGLVEPLVSDILGHGAQLFPLYKYRIWENFVPYPNITINERMQPLMNVVLRDPTFYDLRNRLLYKAITSFGSSKQQIEDLTAIYQNIDADVKADIHKAAIQNTFIGDYPIPYSNAQFDDAKNVLYAWIKKRESYLLGELEKSHVSLTTIKDGANKTDLILVEVSGHSAVSFDPNKIQGRVFADKDLDGTISHNVLQPLRLYPGIKNDEGAEWDLWTIGDKEHLVPSPQRYLFKMDSGTLQQLKSGLMAAFKNAITQSAIKPTFKTTTNIDVKNYVVSEAGLHAWQLGHEPKGSIVLGPGIVDLQSNIHIGSKQRLTIKPNTRVRLAKDISIFSEGKVLIEGSSENPVIFERLNPDDAWGGVAIVGKAANGSLIKNTTFTGGTMNTHATIFFSGMVSVHHVDSIRFINTEFSKNTISDDTLHIVNSQASLLSARFSDCYSDCIDLDYAKTEMDSISIKRAGNDGIDFMGTHAALENIKINGASDKGLSVGENSNISLNSASISNAASGLAVKDASVVDMKNIKFKRNEIAIDIYIKHKIYGKAGSIKAADITFKKNEVNIQNEDQGTIIFHGQKIPNKVTGDGRIEAIN